MRNKTQQEIADERYAKILQAKEDSESAKSFADKYESKKSNHLVKAVYP